MYNKILVAYDGSEHSQRATDAAISLCRGRESICQITLLHVNPLVHYWGGDLIAIDINIEEKINEESMKLLKPAAEKVLHAGIPCNSVIVSGDPALEIYDKAKAEQYDLIVMGSRGLGAFSELVLGSVSHKVAQHAVCPVLIVK
ncbi:universal stress protein [Fodinisporobacter ferrooxydans]|uniref:Universal stress protein n=1 Tax=Fodinisporobacter ferrooxydans TaxID=2901836 RepID=A0ABY4CP96_9BACL|nr:universal stress protein [Alicyclobacillaceae bacterium MYW30-H2]